MDALLTLLPVNDPTVLMSIVVFAAAATLAFGAMAAVRVRGDVRRRAAGVGVGSIYKHFESREELFAEIYSEVAAREFEHVEAAAAAAREGATARIAAAVATFCTRARRANRPRRCRSDP